MSRKGVSTKIWLVALLSFLVFLTILQFVRSVYVNFSNTHQVIEAWQKYGKIVIDFPSVKFDQKDKKTDYH